MRLFDAHTHLGQNDPDGMKQTPAELLGALDAAETIGAAGAFTFPMHELDGYPPANDMVIEAGRGLAGPAIPFCRVSPTTGTAPQEARRALAAGAKGIKLHPRAEQFTLDHPAVRELAQIADERRLPILIHAGRGIPALGRHTVALAREFPDARFILAHAGVSDLAWIWRVAADLPNLLFDTAWFTGADLRRCTRWCRPGQSCSPQTPRTAARRSRRHPDPAGAAAGLSDDQIRSIMSSNRCGSPRVNRCSPRGRRWARTSAPRMCLLDRVAQF